MHELAARKMDQLADTMRSMPSIEIEPTHRFSPGLYSREIQLPAGSLNISKIHKTEHQYIISKGVVQIYDVASGESTLIIAPFHGITKPGTQRAVFALSDSTWTTFHATHLTSPEEIEQEIIQEPDENSITISDEAMQNLKLERLK